MGSRKNRLVKKKQEKRLKFQNTVRGLADFARIVSLFKDWFSL